MNLLSLDLEMNQPSRKIIQIGAAVGNTQTKEITGDLRIYVNPNEPLNPDIITLTGITENHIAEQGLTLREAYDRLVLFTKASQVFINPVTWGGGDSIELMEQLGNRPEDWPFGRRWIDVKTLFVSYRIANNEKIQSGLAKAMTKMGLNFQGRKHDATDDAINTLRLYFELLEIFKENNNE